MHHPTDRITHTMAFVTLAGTRNSSMGPPWRIDPTTHRTMSERSYHGATSRSLMNLCRTNMTPQKKSTFHYLMKSPRHLFRKVAKGLRWSLLTGQGSLWSVQLTRGALKKLSPFAIQKGLVGLAGEPKHIRKWVIVGRVFDG